MVKEERRQGGLNKLGALAWHVHIFVHTFEDAHMHMCTSSKGGEVCIYALNTHVHVHKWTLLVHMYICTSEHLAHMHMCALYAP